MKKLLLAAAVLVIAMVACNEKQSKDSIIGSWVMPIEGQPGKMQGIKLEEGGHLPLIWLRWYINIGSNKEMNFISR